jgi:hypothetical protein
MNHQFFIAGVQFRPRDEINRAVKQLEVGELVSLEREPDNKFDPNAVKILTSIINQDEMEEDIFLGYVPKKFSSEVSALLDYDVVVNCTVTAVNPLAKTYEMIQVELTEDIGEEEPEEWCPRCGEGIECDCEDDL